MRIAFFSETFIPKVDGIVTRPRNTISQLRKAGDEVLIFAPDGGIEECEGAQVVGMPSVPFPLYPELRLALPRTLMRRKLLDFKPDVIHAVDPALLGLAGIYYSTTMRIPLVVSYHTQLPRYLKYYKLGFLEGLVWKLLRVRHRSAEINLCTSAAMVDDLTSHGISRVTLWQRGIDTGLFRPTRASAEMCSHLTQGNPDSPLIIYVGRLSPEKNIEELKELLISIPGAHLALIGGGPHRSVLKQYCEGTATFFPGYMKGEQLASAFASADIFALTSRTETLGLVLLEAMAAGCAVIAVRAGGIPDIIEHGVSGFLFDDARGAVQAAQLLIEDAALRERIRQRALAEAQKWSWTAAADQVRSFYRQAIAEAGYSGSQEEFTFSGPPVTRAAKIAAMGVIRRVLR